MRNTTEKNIIKKTVIFVKKTLKGESTGHDWFHIERVLKTAEKIAKKEGGKLFIIQLAVLLHDIADWKFHKGDIKKGSRVAKKWLSKLDLKKEAVKHICYIIDNVSFKGLGVGSQMKTLEGKIVQDADRLDALGAIGIARVFAFNGWKGNQIYNPRVKPKKHKDFKEYKKINGTAINHFYEKLLHLKNRMNTNTGKKLAEKRHKFMVEYLSLFFKEWEGFI